MKDRVTHLFMTSLTVTENCQSTYEHHILFPKLSVYNPIYALFFFYVGSVHLEDLATVSGRSVEYIYATSSV